MQVLAWLIDSVVLLNTGALGMRAAACCAATVAQAVWSQWASVMWPHLAVMRDL